MRGRKRTTIAVILCLLLFLSVGMLSGFLNASLALRELADPDSEEGREQFRQFEVAAEQLARKADRSRTKDSGDLWDYEELVEDYLYNGGSITVENKKRPTFSWFHLLLPDDVSAGYRELFQTVLSDVECFPVKQDTVGGETFTFENSWGGARSYGGARRHEGTDIMPSNKERGYFAVVSASDGIIEKKGWLQLGGYRLGVRAEHGAYFYYAHLDHYAEGIEEGTKVRAGQLIGYMGDSGYGDEGTVGKFAVHLHFGMYLSVQGEEISVNPYEILRYLEKV